jgi:hypothetical protein
MAGGVTSLWQALPNATNTEVMDYVRQSASQYTTPDYDYGYGIPDLGLALNIGLSLEKDDLSEIKIFPNPVNLILYIKVPEDFEQSTISIYNVLGKLVLQKNITETVNPIDVSSIASGLYIVNLQSEQTTKTFKLIKS